MEDHRCCFALWGAMQLGGDCEEFLSPRGFSQGEINVYKVLQWLTIASGEEVGCIFAIFRHILDWACAKFRESELMFYRQVKVELLEAIGTQNFKRNSHEVIDSLLELFGQYREFGLLERNDEEAVSWVYD